MNAPTAIHTAEDLRRRGNTFRAMLEDTRDLLEILRINGDEDQKAVNAQIEAINKVLTDGAQSG